MTPAGAGPLRVERMPWASARIARLTPTLARDLVRLEEHLLEPGWIARNGIRFNDTTRGHLVRAGTLGAWVIGSLRVVRLLTVFPAAEAAEALGSLLKLPPLDSEPPGPRHLRFKQPDGPSRRLHPAWREALDRLGWVDVPGLVRQVAFLPPRDRERLVAFLGGLGSPPGR